MLRFFNFMSESHHDVNLDGPVKRIKTESTSPDDCLATHPRAFTLFQECK